MERSAGAPPAVAGASRPRFGSSVSLERYLHGELQRAIRHVARSPEKANLKEWKWVWMWGQDAATTAAETAALRL